MSQVGPSFLGGGQGLDPLLVTIGWGLVGVAAGAGIRRLNVWLARLEELEPQSRPYQVYGPPILAGVLFGIFGWRFGATWLLLIQSLWVAVLVQVIFFDFEHHLILDRVLLPGALAALGLSFVTPGLSWQSALLAGLGAGLVFLAIAVLGSFLFKRDAMGLGDVKLSVLMGLMVGFPAIVTAILVGVILAGFVAIGLVILRLRSMQDSIAYGPFLAAGTLLMLYRPQIAGF
jgi:leader peptidase (prepilin peptidase)/N-methyltransferase